VYIFILFRYNGIPNSDNVQMTNRRVDRSEIFDLCNVTRRLQLFMRSRLINIHVYCDAIVVCSFYNANTKAGAH